MLPHWVRDTSSDRLAGVVRLMLGVLFVMTGAMKLVVPMLAATGHLQTSSDLVSDVRFGAVRGRGMPNFRKSGHLRLVTSRERTSHGSALDVSL